MKLFGFQHLFLIYTLQKYKNIVKYTLQKYKNIVKYTLQK
jgi:hypothetical protein